MNNNLRLKQIFSKLNLLIIIYACFFFSCKSNEEKKVNDITKAFEKLEENSGTVSCNINGELNKMEGVQISNSPMDSTLLDCITSNDKYLISFYFPKKLAVGETYNKSNPNLTERNVRSYIIIKSNAVTITQKTAEKIAGTFSCEVEDIDDPTKKISITDGKFEGTIMNIQF